MYIQDLKARTVPYGFWYCTRQAIVLHITEINVNNILNIIKGTTCSVIINEGRQFTHKYHRPVNWHISEERLPSKLLLRNPLHMRNLDMNECDEPKGGLTLHYVYI